MLHTFCLVLVTSLTCLRIFTSMTTSFRALKHIWTKEKELSLVECLVDLVSAGGWKSGNSTFRRGYRVEL